MLIYLSYAKEDDAHGNHLRSLLRPLTRQLGFTLWSLQSTTAGKEWQLEMAAHLKETRLFVPLISASFFDSDRCDAETTAALELAQINHLHIRSVFLSPVMLEYSPLHTTQILPDAKKPITNWNNRENAWLLVQQGIVNCIKEMQLT